MNKTLSILTKSTAKMFVRNRQALFFTLFFPLFIMIILGLIGFNKGQSFDIGLVTGNPQPATQQFIDQIKNFSVFKIHEGTFDQESKDLQDGNLVAVINVPDDFINPATGPKEMVLFTNESQQAQAQAVNSILSQYLDKTSLAIAQVPTYFTIKQSVVNSRNLKYIDFLLPGLIAMSVMQMSVFSVAFVFVQFKEKGVLKRLMATPMKSYHLLTANVLVRLVVSVVQTAIFIAVGVLLLHAHVLGSYFLVFLCVILGVLMFLGLGFTISGLATTVDSVPVFANLVVFPMLFLGGVFFPTNNMPNWLQHIAKVLPLTPFSHAVREVMTKASGFGVIKWDLLEMLAWAIFMITLASFTFRLQEKESS